MPSSATRMHETPEIKPHQMMRGHTKPVGDVVHLPDGRRIITCSDDGSLRVWDLETGVQIGDEWRDDGDETEVFTIALSPNGDMVASGSADGTVRLWDVEKEKVIAKLPGHTGRVQSMLWSADGEHIVTGSEDGTIRVWNLDSGKSMLGPVKSLRLKTGYTRVYGVAYSPDGTKIATTGYHLNESERAIKIWDARTGKLLFTVKHGEEAWTLAWTLDGKKLISGLRNGSIRIFDTATWQQIASLEGHQDGVYSISLFQNDRIIASVSLDETARLWNLNTNLQVGPPLYHEDGVRGVALSTDGKLLATTCNDENAYVWDIGTILKDAGLQDLLSIPEKVTAGKSLMDSDATRRPGPTQLKDTRRLPRDFFHDAGDGVRSSTTPTHPRSSAHHRRHTFAPSSGYGARGLFDRLSQRFHRPQHNPDEPTELQPRTSRSVEVPTVRDKEALHVARRPEKVSEMAKRIKNPTWWTRCILFICCVVPETDGHQ